MLIAFFAGASFAAAGPTTIATFAVLNNGFRIQHVRHEMIGATTRLYLANEPAGSYIDVPTASIAGYEEEEVPAPPVAVPAAKPAQLPRTFKLATADVEQLAAHAAEAHQIDADFISAVIRAESAGQPRAVSPKGAQGLMQLMPQTAAKLGVADTFDPAANVDGGTRYLRELLELYHGDAARALAAYNAGPERVAQYGGVPPYRETRAYVGRVIRDYNRRKAAQTSASVKPRASTLKSGDSAASAASNAAGTTSAR